MTEHATGTEAEQIKTEETAEPLRETARRAFAARFLQKMKQKKILAPLCFLLVFGVLLSCMVGIVSGAVCLKEKDRILTLDELTSLGEHFDCVLVLGCLVYPDGRLCDRLADRVDTGIAVFRTGIADCLLMSGDSRTEDYDETGAMKRYAVEAGIGDEVILTDGAGLSTYESIYRVLNEYGYQKIVIVTQEYHLYRALYLAERFGLEAYGVSATLRRYQKEFKHQAREALARCKDVLYGEWKPEPKNDITD